MRIIRPNDISPSEITPQEVYRERRRFLQDMAALAATPPAGVPVGLLGVLHYLWLMNKELTEPFIYGRVLLCLLPLRLPAIASGLTGLRNRMTHAANKKRG
jgi:hypothetical protein